MGLTILKPELIRGTSANSQIDLGVIGCGGRGSWIADLFAKNGNYNLVAAADYFQDRADAAGPNSMFPKQRGLPAVRLTNGCWNKVRRRGNRIAARTFIPNRPRPLWMPESMSILLNPLQSMFPAANRFSQWAKGYREEADVPRRFPNARDAGLPGGHLAIHNGGIGKLMTVYAEYQTNLMFEDRDAQLRKDPNNPEVRLRTWGIDRCSPATLSLNRISIRRRGHLDCGCRPDQSLWHRRAIAAVPRRLLGPFLVVVLFPG